MKRIFKLSGAVAVLVMLSAAAAVTLSAQETTIYSLQNTNGANPFASLLQANDGNFYGTTYGGGSSVNGGSGAGNGVVFQITPSGTLTVIYTFCSQTNCTDGDLPIGALIQATDGNLYGTTAGGGANNRGTVFKVTLGGSLTTLYSFCNQIGCADGAQPYAGLIQGTDGNFYGTTKFGGANDWGEVFSITSGGTLNTLYSFCPQSGCLDGARPNAVLLQASDGNLYGTTLEGGAGASGGDGTVFKITTGGALTTLYSFCIQTNCTDGSSPATGLIQATNGELYGVTQYGGANNSNGTAYSITTGGALTTLYSFCSQNGCTDGQVPIGRLIQATDGNLYGTTEAGGIGYGTIYSMTPGGTLITLYSFPNEGVGAGPYAGMIQATNGLFYGTTFIGGSAGYGTVYSFSVNVTVPNVVGLTQTAATTSITGVGLVLGTVTMASSSSVPSGDVISQNPTAGTSVNLGSAVNLVISTGPAQVAVPNVVGMTQAAATTSITNAGLVVGTVTTASSATVPSGDAISESPMAGTEVNLGSEVNLVISTGPPLKTQTITFNAIPSQVQGNPLTLSASASSGLTVSFTSSTPTICTVSGTTATLVSAGTCTIVASQGGGSGYAPATPVSQSFTVQAAYTITPNPSAETVVLGGLAAFELEVRSTTGFSGSIKLSCSGGPSGTTCADFPMTIRLTNGYGLAISGIVFPRNTPAGTYTITFTGVSGAISNSATATFTVKAQ
ncbi:MAG: choice-of-anchor tandem repeat GloVer-containing protein [Bryobacteraceae bacterium]|jgi:uncharacterized repeat protein (TIGR03803 family)